MTTSLQPGVDLGLAGAEVEAGTFRKLVHADAEQRDGIVWFGHVHGWLEYSTCGGIDDG
ncbi:MAG: hypothetical protein U5K74_09250 [Gemmatimonadaceae bacterium]|nr:hypothetical protein [Gemmatimonadaceae bacterium]